MLAVEIHKQSISAAFGSVWMNYSYYYNEDFIQTSSEALWNLQDMHPCCQTVHKQDNDSSQRCSVSDPGLSVEAETKKNMSPLGRLAQPHKNWINATNSAITQASCFSVSIRKSSYKIFPLDPAGFGLLHPCCHLFFHFLCNCPYGLYKVMQDKGAI